MAAKQWSGCCASDGAREIAMISLTAGVVTLLAAGFVFGRNRMCWAGSPSARAARRRSTTAILVVIASIPIVTLILAKLFSSDLLLSVS